MNGFQLAGKELKVGIATSDMQMDGSGAPVGGNLALGGGGGINELDDQREGPGQGGMLKGADDRVALMQKLGASGGMGGAMGAPTSLGPGGIAQSFHLGR